MSLQTRYFIDQIPSTPANIQEVNKVEELVSLFKDQTLDLPKLTIVQKTLKAARRAMTDKVSLNRTNTERFKANTQKNDELSVLVFNTMVNCNSRSTSQLLVAY